MKRINFYIKHFLKTLSILLVFILLSTNAIFSQTTYTSTDVPVAISTTDVETITSTLTINDNFSIADINIPLDISHTYVSDLTVTLTSPANTTVTLVANICGSNEDILLVIDDDGGASIPCPPTDGNNYQANGNLSSFDGENINGIWTLSISDNFGGDGGSLNAWSLIITEACSVTAPSLTKN